MSKTGGGWERARGGGGVVRGGETHPNNTLPGRHQTRPPQRSFQHHKIKGVSAQAATVLTPADLAIVNTAYEQLAPGARMSWPALNLPEHKLVAARTHVAKRRKEDGE